MFKKVTLFLIVLILQLVAVLPVSAGTVHTIDFEDYQFIPHFPQDRSPDPFGDDLTLSTQYPGVHFSGTVVKVSSYGAYSGSKVVAVAGGGCLITFDNPVTRVGLMEYGTGVTLTAYNSNHNLVDQVTDPHIDWGAVEHLPDYVYLEVSGSDIRYLEFYQLDYGDWNWFDDLTYETQDVSIPELPSVTWSNPAEIIYRTPLSDTQLNAQASVPGAFVYTLVDGTPATGAVLNAGTHTLNAVFTPTDTTKYSTAMASVQINVNKETPTITWNKPADIIYGTSLSSTQLNAIASVPGTFVYTPASGNILSAGTQTLKVDFTPTDTVNYNSVLQTVTINVLTHVQKIQQITTEVQSLNLIPEQSSSLINKLDTATKNLNDGNTLGAATKLNAFTNQVNADINNGKISSSEGQALIDDTNDLIKAIDNVFNFPAKSVPEFPSVALPIVAILGLILIFGRKKND